ncbi:MAG: TetR/AcrR family transcriptional regulator [Oliverpabstia sp.]
MMEKKSSSTIYTKENIVEAFWKCYEGKKISEVTVKDIMKTAGYNRSTFYQYFDDVNDLLLYAEERLLEQLKKDIEDTLVQGIGNCNGKSIE